MSFHPIWWLVCLSAQETHQWLSCLSMVEFCCWVALWYGRGVSLEVLLSSAWMFVVPVLTFHNRCCSFLFVFFTVISGVLVSLLVVLFPHQCVDTAETSEMWLQWFSCIFCAGFEPGTKNRQCLYRAANPVKKCTTIYKNVLYKFDMYQLTCIQMSRFVKELQTVGEAFHLFHQPHVTILLTRVDDFLL
jgi:hypothetical protein